MHYPDSRWRPRCQGKSRDDVSGRRIKRMVGKCSPSVTGGVTELAVQKVKELN